VASEEAIEPSNFSGRWSLALTEKSTRSLDLALYQTGDLVCGMGVLGSSESSEAGGSSSEDRGIDSMIEWLNLPPSSRPTGMIPRRPLARPIPIMNKEVCDR
jgi:hypothetical protein